MVKDIIKFYNFFKHKHPTEIRVFDEDKYPDGKSLMVNNQDDFFNKTLEYQGINVDVYIGARDRTDKGDKNVASSWFIFLEIDEHDIKKPEQKEKLEKFLKDNGIEIGMSGFSGGGYHYYLPHKEIDFISNPEQRKLYKEQILLAFRSALLEAGIDIDTKIFNLERLGRILGSYNFKRKKKSKILIYNLDVDREKNHEAIKRLVSKYQHETVEVNETAVELLEKYKINETDKWLYDIAKNGIEIKADTGGNSTVFKNTAIILTRECIPEEEIKVIAQSVADLCEDRTLTALYGWITKCENGELSQICKNEINKWVKDNYPMITPYELTEKDKQKNREYAKSIDEDRGIKSFPKGIPGLDFSFNEFFHIGYNKKGEITSKRANIDKVVEYLMDVFTFKTIYGDKFEEIYVYQNGIYTKRGRAIIQTKTEELLKEYATIHNIRETQEKIKRLTEIKRDEFDFIPDGLIPLENGVYNYYTKKLENHNPKYYFKKQFPLEYNPKAICPKILELLNEILYPEYIPVIQEWFGFNTTRQYFIKKAMILFGEKDTGKTQILNLLVKFIGEKNKSGISLQSIAKGNRFEMSFLKDKYANIRDDLSSDDLISGGEFKASTGGSYITAEYKFGDTFEFLTFAKHIFATNKIPKMKDNDNVFYSRCIPIKFDSPIPKEKQNPFILQQITTKEEMSGLLNWALEGLERLHKNNCFSFNKTDLEIKNIMERDSEPLAGFVQDCLTKDEGKQISKEAMFRIYSKYCEIKELPRLSKEQLGRRLPFHCTYILAKRDIERFWENVNLKHTGIDALDTLLKTISQEGNNTIDVYSDKVFEKASKVSCHSKKPIKLPTKVVNGEARYD